METIRKTPLIVAGLGMLLCVAGGLIDGATGRNAGFFGPIGLVLGLAVGGVLLWRTTGKGVLPFLNQFFNPYFGKQREYTACLSVSAPEAQAFHHCASTLHALDLRYDLHADLGTILAYQPARSFLFDTNLTSFGVDVDVKVEPMESGGTLVAVGAKSRRFPIYLWLPSFGERWRYEARQVSEQFYGVLTTILERQGVKYGDLQEL